MPCKSILVIDDDDNVRNTLAAILSQAGYRVVTAGMICDAIENLVAHCFDLVLLDLKMPDMEGQALLSNLHILYPKLPVLVLTAYSALDFAKMADQIETRGYFIKPVEPVQLLHCVKEILSDSPSLQNS